VTTLLLPDLSLNGSQRPATNADGATKARYWTRRGVMFSGAAEHVLASPQVARLRGRIDLIFTSPPFPLNRKKRYGNRQGQEYVQWLASFAPLLRKFLASDGSIVMEMGNTWEPGHPVMSTIALEALLAFARAGNLNLCQQFIWYNPTRLPTPAQWVNVERIRVKDAYTHVWWMSPNEKPHADNRRVLKPYSKAMLKLLSSQKYTAGKRPSEHHIGATSFLRNNSGAIPSNVITLSNTNASDDYLRYCRQHGFSPHPARMPIGLPDFFIRFLTKPRGLVLDPFAGSNTTGATAERLKRRWISIEINDEYIDASKGRFDQTWALRPRAHGIFRAL
jgi:site-specific DNA-methyltransferase (cytosine-N4-specific)